MRAATDGEFRRAWFHLDFLEQLDGVAVTGSIAVELGRRRDGAPDPTEVDRRGHAPPQPPHPGRRLPVPRVRHDGDTEGVDPVADDGALPRRSSWHRHRCVPGSRRVLRRSRRLLPAGDRGPLRGRVPVPAVGRHQPRLPVRSEDAPRGGRAGRRSRRAAARLRRADQRGDRRVDLPTSRSPSTCAGATTAARGSPRAATSPSPRCCSTSSTSTRTSSSTTTNARATSRRCVTCRPARPSSSVSSRASDRTWSPPTSSPRGSTRPRAYVPLERLCLSPQCGFASTIEGNALTEDEQWAKLRLVVDTAQRVWS